MARVQQGNLQCKLMKEKKNIDNGGYGVRVRYMFDKMLCPRIPAVR